MYVKDQLKDKLTEHKPYIDKYRQDLKRGSRLEIGPERIDLSVYGVLAESVDAAHALSMLVWGLGLPLLLWHRFPRLSRAYMWFAIAFVLISVVSHYVLGECILTTMARWLWHASGAARDGAPFMTLLVNDIAGIRPSNRTVVHAWELAVLATSVGSLWCWARTSRKSYAEP